MHRAAVDGVALYRFEALIEASRVSHAFLTRVGGVSRSPYATLNLGHTVGDEVAAVEENHRRGLGAIGLAVGQVVSPYQVHGSRVGVVGKSHRGTVQPSCDALVTDETESYLLLRFADCVPILFFDPIPPAVGLAHAGWRGVASNIAAETVRVMVQRLGCRPERIWAGIGPAIGPCCYNVQPAVVKAVSEGCPPDAAITRHDRTTTYLDLPAAVRAQLKAAGVGNVAESNLCTACRVDEFFSHRTEGGRTGRFGAMIGLVA